MLPRIGSMHRHLLLWALAPLAACATEPSDDAPTSSRAAKGAIVAGPTADRPALEVTLAWGEAEGQIGHRPRQEEFRGEGPSGIALTPDARVLVVDRLNHRLVEIDEAGARTFAELPEDTEHLAVARDGAIAAFSPLRAAALVLDPSGAPIGEVAVPRFGGPPVGVHLDGSRQVIVETGLQERFVAGSPAAPRTEAEVLRSKREGALELADGRGLVSVVRGGRGAVLVQSPAEKGRVETLARVELGEGLASLRLLGLEGDLVVALAERVAQPAEAIEVSRELVVVDVAKGEALGRRALPPPGAWTPTEDVAVGGAPLSVALMIPGEEGLTVTRLPVSSIAAGAASKGGAK